MKIKSRSELIKHTQGKIKDGLAICDKMIECSGLQVNMDRVHDLKLHLKTLEDTINEYIYEEARPK